LAFLLQWGDLLLDCTRSAHIPVFDGMSAKDVKFEQLLLDFGEPLALL